MVRGLWGLVLPWEPLGEIAQENHRTWFRQDPLALAHEAMGSFAWGEGVGILWGEQHLLYPLVRYVYTCGAKRWLGEGMPAAQMSGAPEPTHGWGADL